MKRRTSSRLAIPFLLMAGFFVFLIWASSAYASIPIETNTVWSKAQSPIVVNNYIWLKSGVSLTIEPGVIIKHGIDGMLIISGKLFALGTKAEPIIFTSLKDDASGGDTNHDGAASNPAPGDWWYLNINQGGEANLDYVTIQYGGEYSQGGVRNYKGKLTINHSVITKNNAGVSNTPGQLSISNSSIYNNLAPFIGSVLLDWGVSNNGQASIMVDAKNNWWGTADGPCPWRQLIPSDVPIWQVNIKAICGDKPLVDSGVVYTPWLNAAPSAEPAEPDPVILIPGILGSWEVDGEWKLDPILHTYDNLWQALKNSGYEEGKNLFAFPYEWRQDNNLTAYQLKQKIGEVKQISKRDKVDLVAHSMGGLVARAYAESDYYSGDIDQLVFLGTPHKGAPKSYLTWEGGQVGDQQNELFNLLQKKIFEFEAHNRGYNSLFDYVQNYVRSTEQLLPDYAYLQDIGQTNFRIYDSINHPDNYPYNSFLQSLNSNEKLDLLNNSGINVINIIGENGDNTIGAVEVSSGEQFLPLWRHGYAENLIILAGDGTVPEISSSFFESTKIDDAKHSYLPTKAQKQIIKSLTGSLPAEEFTAFKFPSVLLVIRIFSPADFVIIAPDGQKVGKDFLSGQAVNEISGAFYSGFNTDEEFAVISDPLDGEYKVELQGMGEGEYKLSTSLINDNQEISKEFTGVIAPTQQREFTINYSASAENPISELEPVDTVPPQIVINTPITGGEYLHSNNLIIDYTATDDFSGLASTTITLDGQALATTTIDLFYYLNGEHDLKIIAIDKSGNLASSTVKFKIVSILDSVISDIERLYKLGWITDRTTSKLIGSEIKEIKWHFKLLDEAKKLIDRYIKKVGVSNNNAKTKAKLVQRYNEDMERLDKENDKKLTVIFDRLIKSLGKYLKKALINQAGYDIIMSDINYLRENL